MVGTTGFEPVTTTPPGYSVNKAADVCRTFWFFTKNNDGEPVNPNHSSDWALLVLSLESFSIRTPQQAHMRERILSD